MYFLKLSDGAAKKHTEGNFFASFIYKRVGWAKNTDVGVDRFEASSGDWSLWRLIAIDIDIQHF